MKGMICYILRAKDTIDCSLNGISNRFNEVLLIGDNVPKIFNANGKRPLVKLENHYKNLLRAVPCADDPIFYNYAMGGCFIWSTDSRFPSNYPIPLHDRDMSKENRVINQ